MIMSNIDQNILLKAFLLSLMVGFFAGIIIGVKIYLK
jgi:hypothetical protein